MELFIIDGSLTVLHRNIQTFLLEIREIKHNLSDSFLKDLFSTVYGNYDLRSQSDFGVPGINTVFYGTNSIRHLGSVIWNSLPNDSRNTSAFDLFKTAIWK